MEVTGCLIEKWDEKNPNVTANTARVNECINCFGEDVSQFQLLYQIAGGKQMNATIMISLQNN